MPSEVRSLTHLMYARQESDHNMRATEALATTSPLVTRALLQFLVDAYAHHTAPLRFPEAPPVGKGIGLAFGLFAMQGMWGANSNLSIVS